MKVKIEADIKLNITQEIEDIDLSDIKDMNFLMKCVFAKELGCTLDEIEINKLKINKLN